MSDFIHHPFLKREDTMYLSTVNNNDFKQHQPYFRQSSFLQHDIAGTQPRALVSRYPHQTNFSLSTYIEPIPDRIHRLNKSSNPLFVDDIEGARPRANEFRSKRVVNPLCPKYVLPTAAELVPDEGRKFLRDNLDSKDINGEKSCQLLSKLKIPPKEQIQGSTPQLQTKYLRAKSRLQVKDINKDLLFQTSRRVNPLEPTYNWRDNESRSLNASYGEIGGTHPLNLHKTTPNRPKDLCLGIKDIEGSQVSSMQAKRHFMDKRREFRNYMMTQDIDKSTASSLPKGITTKRQTNPLMPNYQYPGRTQVA